MPCCWQHGMELLMSAVSVRYKYDASQKGRPRQGRSRDGQTRYAMLHAHYQLQSKTHSRESRLWPYLWTSLQGKTLLGF